MNPYTRFSGKGKVAVIQFPGANCDRDALDAVLSVGLDGFLFHYRDDLALLRQADGIVVPGGFTWQDRGRAGYVASRRTEIMDILNEKNEQGAPILGICNGDQTLIEAGIVPGEGLELVMAGNEGMLAGQVVNKDFYNDWVTIRSSQPEARSAFTIGIDRGWLACIPVAHAEGNYQPKDQETLDRLLADGHVLFQYCNADGVRHPDFPVNPNGAVANIAALCNFAGNAVAIMPHPERRIGGMVSDGFAMFDSMRQYLEGFALSGNTCRVDGGALMPESLELLRPEGLVGVELYVRWLTTDNEAFTLGLEAEKMGADRLERFDYWKVYVDEQHPDVPGLVREMIRRATFVKTTKHEAMVKLPDGNWYDFMNSSGEFRKAELPRSSDAERVHIYDVLARPKRDHLGSFHDCHFVEVQNLPVEGVDSGKLWRVYFSGDRVDARAGLDNMLHAKLFGHPITHNIEERYLG